jgi:uncharacterized protein YdhG (YjbR/CyaY superfamily)
MHESELAGFSKTKAVLRLPLDAQPPMPLVRKLIKASLKIMKDNAAKKASLKGRHELAVKAEST